MGKSSHDILQEIRNAVDTSETGWDRYAEAVIPLYNTAYTNHVNTLSSLKTAIAKAEEEGWLVFSTILSLTAGFWVPRFLKPVTPAAKGISDNLVKLWVSLPISKGMKRFGVHVGTEVGKEVLSHVGETLKLQAHEIMTSSGEDAFEPVVETTINWGGKLKEGIKDRAFILKKGLDEIIKNSDSWSVPAAEFLQKSFESYCPFIVDMPGDPNEGNYKSEFQRISELAMWRAWGLVRDEKWWKDNPSHEHGKILGPPMFYRLTSLGVAPIEIADYISSYGGTTLVTARRPGWRFNMVKFIDWSKKYSPALAFAKNQRSIGEPDVCRYVDDKYKALCRPVQVR